MKFARYFQDAQTPEWKNAYIDYRGLKAQLRVIRAKGPEEVNTSGPSTLSVTVVDHSARNYEGQSYDTREAYMGQGSRTCYATFNGSTESHGHGRTKRRMSHHEILPAFDDSVPSTPSTLHTILCNLPATHAKFFDMLGTELAKVETFYSEREKDMHEHAKLLKAQLHELGIHRQTFYESTTRMNAQNWAKKAYLSLSPAISALARFSKPKTKHREAHQTDKDAWRGRRSFVDSLHIGLGHTRMSVDHSGTQRKEATPKPLSTNDYSPEVLEEFVRLRFQQTSAVPDQTTGGKKHSFDPQEYQNAKRRLRKAVSEHYRGLDALNSYRILNLAGFRKALRKYGKITKTSVLDAYMKEKIEPTTFASGALVSNMLKEVEHNFAMRFEHGDKKKAMGHLKSGPSSKTYHSSTFRSGIWLGLAFPAIIAGCGLAFQEYTRKSLPSWDILLFIYSIFVIPVLMTVLIGINVVAWARNKINYVFIFELDPRSRLNYHEYFELPSLLLCTLAYAFYFSFAQVGPPMLWPLIWATLTLAIMLNPLRSFMWGRARWWTNRKMAKLGTSGMWKVEFTDVWLGDLCCSLVYSFSNLFFVGCFYNRFALRTPSSIIHPSNKSESSLYAAFPVNFTTSYQVESSASNSALHYLFTAAYDLQVQDAWMTCGVPQNWGWYCLLSTLPFLVRMVQCLRRYRDTKLSTQLLNAGKYGMSIIYYIFYFYWRQQMNGSRSYVLWCFMATLNSIYAFAWDILMDWRLCRPQAQYPLLRPELVYSSHIPYYYFAIISDLGIRFIWLGYIFLDESNIEQGVFIASMLEMLRRVQWNFFRLENKHLNNMNLYRATREVPLPYSYSLDAQDEGARAQSQLRKRLAHLS